MIKSSPIFSEILNDCLRKNQEYKIITQKLDLIDQKPSLQKEIMSHLFRIISILILTNKRIIKMKENCIHH
jgi:hypothetical protein